MHKSSRFNGRLLLAGLMAALTASPVLAQLDEITVTARRIEESLQNAPVAVTALTAQTLETARIRNINDLVNFVPNMTFEGGETGRRSTPVVRGLGLIDVRGFDNNVGVFIDGVFVSGRAAQNVQMLDLERVEVVRGPQSALYGRSTFAGAINYVTRKPDAEFDGYIEGTAAQDDYYEVLGAISGPLLGETLTGRLGFSYRNDDGQYRNAGPLDKGGGIGGSESKVVTGVLRWMPTQALDISLTGFYSDDRVDNRPLYSNENNCGELNPALSNITVSSYDLGVPHTYCGKVRPSPGKSLSMSPDAYSQEGDTSRISLDVAYELDGALFQSITSYTRNKNLAKADLDRTQAGEPFYGYMPLADFQALGSPPIIFNWSNFPNTGIGSFNTYFGATGLDQEYWSQEFRLTSKASGPLRWTGGLFYFYAENDDTSDLGLDATPAIQALGLQPDQIQFMLVSELPSGAFLGIPTPILPNKAFKAGSDMETLILARTETSQYSIFGSLEYDFTERLTGIAELRYTYEERKLDNVFDDFFGTPTGTFKNDWKYWDPRFILRYNPSDAAMVYGSISKGTRAGGQNPAIDDATLVPYDEETNWTYEIGAKTGWFDNRLQVNGALFYVDWKDAQFRQRTPSVNQGGGLLTITTNSAGVTSYGAELEVLASPFDGVTIGGSFGYNDSTYDDGTIAFGDARLCDLFTAPGSTSIPLVPVNCVVIPGLDRSGNPDKAPDIGGKQLIRTSSHTASFLAQIIRPATPTLDALLRFDLSYRSKQYQDHSNTHWVPSRTLASLRLGVQSRRYDVIVWIENLLDEDAPENTQSFPSNLNSLRDVVTATNIDPRRVGVTARYRFGAVNN
jgi:iron complex outermembrane receptor protein